MPTMDLTADRCPSCGSREMLTLDMIVRDSDLRFTCCAACESRWWHREGSSIPLRSVLDMVSPG